MVRLSDPGGHRENERGAEAGNPPEARRDDWGIVSAKGGSEACHRFGSG